MPLTAARTAVGNPMATITHNRACQPLRLGACSQRSSMAQFIWLALPRTDSRAALSTIAAPSQFALVSSARTFCAFLIALGGRLPCRLPPRSQLTRRLHVGWEVDLAPFLALDVERPHLAVLREVMNHPQIPDSCAFGGPHCALD